MDEEARGRGGDGVASGLPIDEAFLARIVASSLGRPVSVVGDVRAEALSGFGFSGSIHRISGVTSDGTGQTDWSIIRKHIADTGDSEADLRYWRREPLAYASGLLDDLPGVYAPRCHAVVDDGHGTEIWLDDVASDADPWDFARTEIAARHLGTFNGSYLDGRRDVPVHRWLSRGWLTAWVEQAAVAFDELDAAVDDPWISRIYPPAVVKQARTLWNARRDLLRSLGDIPQSLAHLDVIQHNTFVHEQRTTLVDWAFVGLAPLGEDLAPLIAGSTLFGAMTPERLLDLDQTGFTSYIEGLRTSGWRGEVRDVRFAYCTAAALRFGVGLMGFYVCGFGPDGGIAHNGGVRDAEQRTTFETMFQTTIDEHLDTVAATNQFLMTLGSEALALFSDR